MDKSLKDPKSTWERFKKFYLNIKEIGFALDISRIPFNEEYLISMEHRMQEAFVSMAELEKGSLANPDEKRMVGHYWLRNPQLAPNLKISEEIISTLVHIKEFAKKVHTGESKGSSGLFKNILIIGIGGSALGPQFVSQALGHSKSDKMRPYFFDNTDPDGMDVVLDRLDGKLGETLVIVISKSGGTPETRNGMVEAEQAYAKAGLDFSKHAVAITSYGSKLDKYATEKGWLERFPMWDWVGGRTSELAAVGLLPAALQGLNIQGMLDGAKAMDKSTRENCTQENPAALMALMWFHTTDGKGKKDMVILSYKERLSLFSKYLQQLVMESLGKEKDLEGRVVHQGIAVYGNKGSTDQHAYVQQLREGVNNFFVTFIEVLKDRSGPSIEVEPGNTSGDYLQALLLGTRNALFDNDRHSITITINEVTPITVGALIALYERAVGFYATLVRINAYHQPGVEAGKKAASSILELKKKLVKHLESHPGKEFTIETIAEAIQRPHSAELVFKLLDHMAANPEKKLKKVEKKPFYESLYFYNE